MEQAQPHGRPYGESYGARVAERSDNCCRDDEAPSIDSLLETLYPHYLRAFPSCTIARAGHGGQADPAAITTIPRGTVMRSAPVRGVRCRFTSAGAIALAPLELAAVRFDPVIDAAIDAPPGVNGAIRIVIESAGAAPLSELAPGRVRVFIDGDAAFCAALRDTLFMLVAGAWIESDGGAPDALDGVPLHAAGFADDDALIPYTLRAHPAYRLLAEYFAFPEKFNFFDLDLAPIVARVAAGCRRVTLHLALRVDAARARALAGLSASNLVLHCAPLVNLFRRASVPIGVTTAAPDYALLADADQPQAYEIYNIESARLTQDAGPDAGASAELRPFYGARHGHGASASGHYWITRRHQVAARHRPGHELRIGLVDSDLRPVNAEGRRLRAELTCSNRDLPAALGRGLPGGELDIAGAFGGIPVTLLRQPTAPARFKAGKDARWRLIAPLSLNHRTLSGVGLREFQDILALYDLPRSAATRRQIAGIVDLRYKNIMARLPGRAGGAPTPGVEVRMTLDEAAFAASGIHAFAQVIDHFFGLCGQADAFTQLVVQSRESGRELLRCAPRGGTSARA